MIKEFIRVAKALSDPNRVKMIKILQCRVLCVCEIREALGLAQSTASKHLKILEEAGLIDSSKDGLWVNYRLADGSKSPYAALMLGSMRHWLEDDPEMLALAERLPNIRREILCANKPSIVNISPYDETRIYRRLKNSPQSRIEEPMA